MNGYDGYETEDYTPLASEPMITTEAAAGGNVGGFFSQVQGAFTTFAEKFSERPTSTESGVAGALYNAIYAFGAGKIDQAREQAAKALLASKTGARYVQEVERQRLMQRLPLIIAIGAGLFAIMYFLARR